MAALSLDAPLCSSVALPQTGLQRAESTTSESSEGSHDATPTMPNIQALVRQCNWLAATYLLCSVVTFCSSAYTGAGSALDVVVVMSDVICVDVSSALFVMAGSAVAAIMATSNAGKQQLIARQTALIMLIDLYAATACCLVLGSLHALMLMRFRWSDLVFTAVDGLTTARGLDFRQTSAAPHPFNVTAWPVQSLLWCVLGTSGLVQMETWLVTRAPLLADPLICVTAVLGIILFTAFGSMQSASNIFYANASSVTYRSLEFNLGVHVIFLMGRHAEMTAVLRRLCQHASGFVAVLTITVWISEIGRPVPTRSDESCLRLYHRNTCMQDHHGFFLRGCVVALFALLSTSTGPPDNLARELHLASVLVPAMAFCWPVCIAVKVVLDVTFGGTLVNQNRPVVLVISACVLGIFSCWYVSIVQPCLAAGARRLLRSDATVAAPPSDSLHTPLV